MMDVNKIYIMQRNLIIVLFVFTIFFSCKNQDDSLLIVRGKGVGSFRLGEKLINVDYNKENFYFISNQNDSIINSIDILSSKYYTEKGIKIGDDYMKVKELYGKPLEQPKMQKGNRIIQTKRNEKYIPYNISYKGISFFLNQENGTVIKIRVF